MRWNVEVTAIDKTESQAVVVEAESWQRALQAARARRGESGPISGFSIELLDEGYRAVDPMARLRYTVKREGETTSIVPPGPSTATAPATAKAPPATTSTSASPSVAPPSASPSSAPTAVAPIPSATAAAGGLPPRPAPAASVAAPVAVPVAAPVAVPVAAPVAVATAAPA